MSMFKIQSFSISGLFIVLFTAEIGSSLWRVLTLPSDAYPGSLNYVVGRLLFWLPLVVLLRILWSLLGRRFEPSTDQPKDKNGKRKGQSPSPPLVLVLGAAFIIEMLTDVLHWESRYSSGIRVLYESVWYWHRVPSQTDYGWPSFRGYFVDHLIPWAVIFVTGLVIRFIWSRRRRAQRNMPAV